VPSRLQVKNRLKKVAEKVKDFDVRMGTAEVRV
jgi:hypothetical protein